MSSQYANCAVVALNHFWKITFSLPSSDRHKNRGVAHQRQRRGHTEPSTLNHLLIAVLNLQVMSQFNSKPLACEVLCL